METSVPAVGRIAPPARKTRGIPSQGPARFAKAPARKSLRADLRAFCKANGQPAGARRKGGGLR